jgi:PAPA-1-like conserved region
MFHWVRLRLSCWVVGNGLTEGGLKKDETSRKKKQLNEAEIALRREETARKRKHLSEKKLEDEKVRPFPPFPHSYNDRGHPFLMPALFLYTRRRRSTVYLRRSPVRGISATRSQVRKTARPQLTRATARQRRAKSTKKRTAKPQQQRYRRRQWQQQAQRPK